MGEMIKMLDSKGERQLKVYLSNANRADIDNCECTVHRHYCHGKGHTTPGDQNPTTLRTSVPARACTEQD
jgi:hypothetical protein